MCGFEFNFPGWIVKYLVRYQIVHDEFRMLFKTLNVKEKTSIRGKKLVFLLIFYYIKL